MNNYLFSFLFDIMHLIIQTKHRVCDKKMFICLAHRIYITKINNTA